MKTQYKEIIENFVAQLNMISNERVDKIELNFPYHVFERIATEYEFNLHPTQLAKIEINSGYGTNIIVRKVEYNMEDLENRIYFAEEKLNEIDKNWWKQ